MKSSNVEAVGEEKKKETGEIGERKVRGHETGNKSREAWTFTIFEKRNKRGKWMMGVGKERNMKRGRSLTG